jgi:hypothetical protein
VLGDTNSCLSVIPAKRRKVPIFHMEAGNRCFDLRVSALTKLGRSCNNGGRMYQLRKRRTFFFQLSIKFLLGFLCLCFAPQTQKALNPIIQLF